MSEPNIEAMARKMEIVLAGATMGLIDPDPLDLLWAAGIFKAHGELKLARECERLARTMLPNLSRDLA
jgi:hypothetical protein